MRHLGISGLCRTAAAAGALVLAFGLNVARPHAEPLAFLPTAKVLSPGRGDSEPTAAWKAFCERLPDECRIDPAEAAVVELTPSVWVLLRATNDHVNATIKPMTDREHWGVEDRWDYPTDGYGDCEDYQLLKRKLLVEAGLPRRAMRMTVVIDKDGDGHAVLMVRTNRGDFILDNKAGAVLAWEDTGYEFVKREGSDTLAWIALGPDTRTVVASRSVRKVARGATKPAATATRVAPRRGRLALAW